MHWGRTMKCTIQCDEIQLQKNGIVVVSCLGSAQPSIELGPHFVQRRGFTNTRGYNKKTKFG